MSFIYYKYILARGNRGEILNFNIFFNKSVKILHALEKSYMNVAEITYLCTDNKAERGLVFIRPPMLS